MPPSSCHFHIAMILERRSGAVTFTSVHNRAQNSTCCDLRTSIASSTACGKCRINLTQSLTVWPSFLPHRSNRESPLSSTGVTLPQ